MANWFTSDQTADEIKKAYKALVKAWHPDINDSPDATKVMQDINAAFAQAYARAATNEVRNGKTESRPQSADYYRTTYTELFAAALAVAIDWLLDNGIYTRDDLTAELCGVFIWISGVALRDEPATRATLKASGYNYSAGKQAWFYTPTSTSGHKATGKSLDAIRNTYGSEKINSRYSQLD